MFLEEAELNEKLLTRLKGDTCQICLLRHAFSILQRHEHPQQKSSAKKWYKSIHSKRREEKRISLNPRISLSATKSIWVAEQTYVMEVAVEAVLFSTIRRSTKERRSFKSPYLKHFPVCSTSVRHQRWHRGEEPYKCTVWEWMLLKLCTYHSSDNSHRWGRGLFLAEVTLEKHLDSNHTWWSISESKARRKWSFTMASYCEALFIDIHQEIWNLGWMAWEWISRNSFVTAQSLKMERWERKV